jgi:hypothetical protein
MTDHKKFISPVYVGVIPNNTQYKQGVYNRYFVISEIGKDVIEIDKKQFDILENDKKGINPTLWKGVKVRWKLRGPLHDKFDTAGRLVKKGIYTVNKNTVDNIVKTSPKITSAITSYVLYGIIETESENNILALPGELVYKSNPSREYVGEYHIHSIKGPMEGPTHTNEDHELLVFSKDLDSLTSQAPETSQQESTNQGGY